MLFNGDDNGDDDNNDNGDDYQSTSWTNDDKAKKELNKWSTYKRKSYIIAFLKLDSLIHF